MSDYDFKYRVPESLEDLCVIIALVERNPPSILPTFLSLTYGGYENEWDHADANFLCSVEYDQKDVDSQMRALEALKRLSEHISANQKDWELPTGKSVTTKWCRAPAPDNTYHLQITENSIMDPSMSEHGDHGGFSFNLSAGPLQVGYIRRGTSRIGLLVSHRYRSQKE